MNYVLKRRLELLDEVGRLQRSLDLPAIGDVSYTCETVAFFYVQHVLSRWERFLDALDELRRRATAAAQPVDPTAIQRMFPFSKFFKTGSEQQLFLGTLQYTDLRVHILCTSVQYQANGPYISHSDYFLTTYKVHINLQY